VLHLVVGEVAEAREDHEQVGGLQRLEPGDVVRLPGVDAPVLLVDGEEHRAVEPVVTREDLCELRQRLLGAVLLVAGDEDDALALAGAVLPLEHDPGIRGGRACRAEKDEGRSCVKSREGWELHLCLSSSGCVSCISRRASRSRTHIMAYARDGEQGPRVETRLRWARTLDSVPPGVYFTI
jgi:hypothetical protein